MGSRLSAENWIGEGLGILSRFGESALTLARLCEATGKTRGSFYHHFDSMESYVDSLLERWRLDHTESVISLANEEVAAQDRLARLEREVAGLDHRLDQIIRRWADYQPRAKVSVEAVDEIRVGYIAECLEAYGFSPEHARSCAELEYLMFLGAQQRAGVLGSERSHVLQTMFRQAMQLYRDHAAGGPARD